MTANDFTFHTRADYFQTLIQLVQESKPGQRIIITAMEFDAREPLIQQLVDTLCSAAKRGAKISFSIDAYTFLNRKRSPIPGPLWKLNKLPNHLPEPYETQLAALRKLGASGVTYAITNMPTHRFTAPPIGRSHIKAAIVGDDVFVGGCNLESPDEIDIMVHFKSTITADWLSDQLGKIISMGSTQQALKGHDQQFHIPDGPTLLIDSGKRNQSLIFDRALKVISTAQKQLFITCQYFPGGITGRYLRAAHKKGVAVEIVYNAPQAHGKKALMHYVYNARERMRLPSSFFARPLSAGGAYLHAKVLVSDTAAMVGSHNYISQGVTFGTAEIALEWHNTAFAQALQAFITKTIHTEFKNPTS